MNNGHDRLLTTDEMARELRVAPETVRRHARAGIIPVLQLLGHNRYDADAVKAALEAMGTRRTADGSKSKKAAKRPTRRASGGGTGKKAKKAKRKATTDNTGPQTGGKR